jgi:MFS family permease
MLLFGLTVLVAGLGLFAAVLQPGTSYFPGLFAAYALIGVGAGTSFMTLVTLALADVPAEDAGIASGLVNVSVQISAALGLAVLGTVAAGQTGRLADQGETAVHALSGGYQLAFVVAAGCVALALLLSALFIQSPDSPERVPAQVRAEAEPA